MFGEHGPHARYEIKPEHSDISKRSKTRALAAKKANQVISEVHEFGLVGATPARVSVQQRRVTEVAALGWRNVRKGLGPMRG